MATTDTAWYELIDSGAVFSPNQRVQCETFATAVSIEEMAEVVVACVEPMTQMAYQIYDRQGNTVREGGYTFGDEGVTRFVLKDVLPLEELKPYETENADYGISTTVTLASGHEVGSYFSFKAYLRSGKTATEAPRMNLKEQLAAIPVAQPGMTEAQLRQICLDYMKLQLEFPFKFKEDFNYVVFSQKRRRKLLGGKVYGGLPYVTRGAGNLYRIAEIYDPETGTLDADSEIFENIRYFGNACSGAASMSWARVVTSAYMGYTMFMTEANGFLPVGPYRYPKPEITIFPKNDPNAIRCHTICEFNGEQTMFESYARMKPADGVVCNGHVRMNSAVPVVVRKKDGTIDGEKSYTLMREQVCYVSHINHLRITPNGDHYVAQGYVDIRYTFQELFDSKYIPFTFAEFLDPSRVEPARIRLAVEPELHERVLSANYAISEVFIELDGKRYVYHNMEFFRREVKMSDIFPREILTKDAKIYCQLLNGELLEVKQ